MAQGDTRANRVRTAAVATSIAASSWGSPNVWLYNPDGSYLGNRFVRGAAIYKARPVVWERR